MGKGADLSSFEAFKETLSAFQAGNVNVDKTEHIGNETWSYKGGEQFTTPGADDRFQAAWYGYYLVRCARKGVEPGPFTTDDEG